MLRSLNDGKSIYFYGWILKIRLFCKVKTDKIHEVKEAYRSNLGVYLNIDYEVLSYNKCGF